jgi:type IV fimbrial biogenesis protein FimT
MQPVSARRRAAAAGFTLLESMVALGVLGLTLAIGVPAMSGWVQGAKARGAVEFYAEGLALARQLAIAHNSVSRFALLPNTANGQNDWQVDICFPTAAAPCTAASSNWSTTTAAASGDPDPGTPFKSVRRSAAALPATAIMTVSLLPAGADDIYFTALGWVNTVMPDRMTAIRLGPAAGYERQIRPQALVVGLAGTTTKCDWSVAIPDSRACPP